MKVNKVVIMCFTENRLQYVPITDGDKKVFRCRGEKFKVSDVQLIHLDGLAELYDKPEKSKKNFFKKQLELLGHEAAES